MQQRNQPVDATEQRQRLLEWIADQHPQTGLILRILYECYPNEMSMAALAEAVQVTPTIAEFKSFCARLDHLQYVVLVTAGKSSDEFGRPAIRAVGFNLKKDMPPDEVADHLSYIQELPGAVLDLDDATAAQLAVDRIMELEADNAKQYRGRRARYVGERGLNPKLAEPEPVPRAGSESLAELRRRLVKWAENQDIQTGWILRDLFDRYPSEISLADLAEAVEVRLTVSAYDQFYSQLERLRSAGLVEDGDSRDEFGRPVVRAAGFAFKK